MKDSQVALSSKVDKLADTVKEHMKQVGRSLKEQEQITGEH